MPDVRLVFGACAAMTVIALPPTPADAARPCPRIVANVSGDKAGVIDHHQEQPTGGELEGGKIRYPGHFYETTGAIRIVVRGNTYSVGPDAIFRFTCYGRSRSDRKLKPAMEILRGTVVVKTSASAPGGVSTEEGLYDPRQDPTMTYTVKRVLSEMGEPTLEEILHWFGEYADQPTGTTTVSSKQILGVTPYVGSRKGSCRYVRGATLTTKGRYGNGTAKYRY